MPITTLYLPKPISVNSMFGQSPGHKRYKSSAYKKWIKEATAMLREQNPHSYGGEVEIIITLKDAGRTDCDNRAKGILDLLVSEGIIVDDSREYLRLLVLQFGDVDGCKVVVAEYGEFPLVIYTGEIE